MKILVILFFLSFSSVALCQIDTLSDTTQIQPVLSTTKDAMNKMDELKEEIIANPIPSSTDTASQGLPIFSELISLQKVIWGIILIAIGYISIRLISKILELLAEKSTRYRITIKSFIPVIKIMGWITLVSIIIAGIFRPPAATLLAFSASIGFAIGFASQDILKNIFGGIMILFDRPFQTGDKIKVGEHYGEVVEIGLRSTRIVTPDDNLVSIPNSEIMNTSVANANAGEPTCQVVADIYLPIETDTIKAREFATQAAQVSRFVYLNKPITIIFVNEFKDRESLLKMKIKAYVLDIRDEFKFISEITEIVIKELVNANIIKSSKIT